MHMQIKIKKHDRSNIIIPDKRKTFHKNTQKNKCFFFCFVSLGRKKPTRPERNAYAEKYKLGW